ncbi:MAG: hypothetical protein ACPGFA_06055 [Pikeienuella sp.]
MKLFGALLGAVILTAGAAQADTLSGFDEQGNAKTIDTAAVSGCTVLYDSAGNALEICKLQKVQLRPAASTRSRPGSSNDQPAAAVVFKRVAD